MNITDLTKELKPAIYVVYYLEASTTVFKYNVLCSSQLVQEWPPNSPEIIICQIWQILGETTLKESKRISPYSLTDWGYNLKKDNITFTIWFQHHSMEHRKYRY